MAVTLKYAAEEHSSTITALSGTSAFSVSAGSTLICQWSGLDTAQLAPPSSDIGGLFVQDVRAMNAFVDSAKTQSGIAYLPNCKAGTHTISLPTIQAGGGGDYALIISEATGFDAVPDVLTCAKLAQLSNATTITLTTAASPNKPLAGAWAFAVRTHENSITLADAQVTDPVSGWTTTYAYQPANVNLPTIGNHKQLTADGNFSIAWTTVDTNVTHTSAAVMVIRPRQFRSTYNLPPRRS